MKNVNQAIHSGDLSGHYHYHHYHHHHHHHHHYCCYLQEDIFDLLSDGMKDEKDKLKIRDAGDGRMKF